MKVLQVHARYRVEGGEEIVVARERALLEAAGHEVTTFERANAALAVRSRSAQLRATIWNRTAAREVAAEARRVGVEVVHVHNTFPALSPSVHAAARSTGAAVVVTLHNHRIACVNGLLLRNGTACTLCVGRRVATPGIRHACAEGDRARSAVVATMQVTARARGAWSWAVDRVIVPTRFGADVARLSGIATDVLVVRPHGVPAPLQPTAPVDERDGVLYVGRLSPEKGPDLLLDAWALLGDGAPPLALVGDGPMAAELRARIERDGLSNVRLLEGLDAQSLARERARTRLAAVPSRALESFGLTAAEAAAAGIPAIVSGHGAIGSLVIDGETGWHVPPGDAAALAATVAAAYADTAEIATRGAAAHARWQAEWSEPAALASLESIYAAAIEHRAPHR